MEQSQMLVKFHLAFRKVQYWDHYYFYFFINDLPLVLSKNGLAIDLYADDTTIYDIQSDLETLR